MHLKISSPVRRQSRIDLGWKGSIDLQLSCSFQGTPCVLLLAQPWSNRRVNNYFKYDIHWPGACLEVRHLQLEVSCMWCCFPARVRSPQAPYTMTFVLAFYPKPETGFISLKSCVTCWLERSVWFQMKSNTFWGFPSPADPGATSPGLQNRPW